MLTLRLLNPNLISHSKEELQSIGRGIALVAEAIKLPVNHPEINQGSFAVRIDNQKMVKFTERRLKPYLDSFRKSFISSKFIYNSMFG